MATFDYAGLRDEAEALIEEFGKSATLIERGPQIAGPDWNPTFGPDVEYPVTLVEEGYETEPIPNTQVQRGDARLLVSTKGLTIDPDTSHRINVDGRVHQIVEVKRERPGPTTMVYQVWARA